MQLTPAQLSQKFSRLCDITQGCAYKEEIQNKTPEGVWGSQYFSPINLRMTYYKQSMYSPITKTSMSQPMVLRKQTTTEMIVMMTAMMVLVLDSKLPSNAGDTIMVVMV